MISSSNSIWNLEEEKKLPKFIHLWPFIICPIKYLFPTFLPHHTAFLCSKLVMISSAESQKGAIADQRCSVENQKGDIAINFVQQ